MLLLVLAFLACQAKPPPLSPQAAAFKKDILEIVGKLTPVLGAPLGRDDSQAVLDAILAVYPQAAAETDDFPFRVGVLDQNGILVAFLPTIKVDPGANFSHYGLVQEILRQRRLGKARLYAPDGSPIYFIAAPVMTQGRLAGILSLRLTAAKVQKKWGLTEQEFLEMHLD